MVLDLIKRTKYLLEISPRDIPWEEIERQFSFLNRQSLDTGEVWQSQEWQEGPFQASKRLDTHLLTSLKSLGGELIGDGLDQENAHGLIGKYIYLQYMRHRDFLSNQLLKKWDIEPDSIFTRKATLTAFNKLDDKLHEELNGTIFPMPSNGFIFSVIYEFLMAIPSIFSSQRNVITGQKAKPSLMPTVSLPTSLQ